MRFQPRVGRLLAAAAESTVNIIDIEAESMQIRTLKVIIYKLINVHCLVKFVIIFLTDALLW